jgi:hypothetical protein
MFGGNAVARATAEDVKRNAEIEKLIKKDKKQMARNVKILLLGTSTPENCLPFSVVLLSTRRK